MIAFKNLIPDVVLRSHWLFRWRLSKWKKDNKFSDEPDEWVPHGCDSGAPKIGIIKEFADQHWPFIAACRERGVPYELIDISKLKWLDTLKRSQCAGFLVRPSAQYRPWKEMYDERLRVFRSIDSRPIHPSLDSIWIWESKRRMQYFLESTNTPHPNTYIFYDQIDAENFGASCNLPTIIKTDGGSGASGVFICRSRREIKNLISKFFNKGVGSSRRVKTDQDYGAIIFQEYLANVREWRAVRMGDSYFAYEKGAVDGLHSGSKSFLYGRPPDELLNMVRRVTDVGGFYDVSVDVFETVHGEFLVNEIQAIFGQLHSREICRVNGVSGRMIYSEENNAWEFEEGSFCQNYFSNLRLEVLLDAIGKKSDSNVPSTVGVHLSLPEDL